MDKLVNITGARIGDIAHHYADYRFAVSNADDALIVYYGSKVLAHCAALGFTPNVIDKGMQAVVETAAKRQDRVLWRAGNPVDPE